MSLKAPFQYFGGKSRAAAIIWSRLGNTPNYVEPFFGSGAVLLSRPHAPGIETINDKDAYLVNFWRAIQADPEGAAKWADWPVSEVDLLARHRWLMDTGRERLRALKTDPGYFDAKVAGWWVWGLCCWIGSGWCVERGNGDQPEQIPHLGNAGRGARIKEYFVALSERLRDVRICCGEWNRVVGPTVTTKLGLTAVFLDPPYTEGDMQYSAGGCGGDVARAAQEWAVANGDNPELRIALAGYEGEHNMPQSWECVRWKPRKGYQARDGAVEDRGRERIWFSPHCLRPQENLFHALTESDSQGVCL